MIVIKRDRHYDKLEKRRGEILRTLEYLQNEQRMVDENTDWIDRAAYASRCHLLGSLATWYANETARINAALKRITEGRYGVCLGCREPIEAHRLETTPEMDFCAACQKDREGLAD
jgi:RNA polymerase-binding transcription factor DksA